MSQSLVLFFRRSTRSGSCDWISRHLSFFHRYQAFRTGPNDLVVSKVIEIKIVGRIGHAQISVIIQGISLEVCWEALTEDTLEHIAFADQLLSLIHHLHKNFLLNVVAELQSLQGLRGELIGRLGLQIDHHLPQWLTDCIIAPTRVDIVLHHIDFFLLVVKNHIGLVDEEMHVWCPDRILRNPSNLFVNPDHIIACKTDSSTGKRKIRRQSLDRYLVEIVKRILLQHLAILIQDPILIDHLKYWIIGHDRKAGVLLLTRDRLKDDLMVTLDTHVG